jgi:hypothetical protein
MNIVRNVPLLAPLSGYAQKKIVDVRETCFWPFLTLHVEAKVSTDSISTLAPALITFPVVDSSRRWRWISTKTVRFWLRKVTLRFDST